MRLQAGLQSANKEGVLIRVKSTSLCFHLEPGSAAIVRVCLGKGDLFSVQVFFAAALSIEQKLLTPGHS